MQSFSPRRTNHTHLPGVAVPEPFRLLIADDDDADRAAVASALVASGMAGTCDEARPAAGVPALLATGAYDCVVLSGTLPDRTIAELVVGLRTAELYAPILVVTDQQDED